MKLSVTLGFQVACQERSHYTTFAACLKPLVTEEVAMLREVEQLDSVMEKISKMISDPYRSLDNCEDVLSLISQSDERFGMVSATPPGSPGSTLGSRTASLRSVRLLISFINICQHRNLHKRNLLPQLPTNLYLSQLTYY